MGALTGTSDTLTVSGVAAVAYAPEPATLSAVGLSCLMLLARRRRQV
jgi:hypothetical protein